MHTETHSEEGQPGDNDAGGAEHRSDLTAVRDVAAEAAPSRLLWFGAGLALLAHLAPFLLFGEPDQLGDDVLTEGIAVELVDAAELDGQDQTPTTPPAAAAPAAPPMPQAPPARPGPPQKAQQAIAPSPPPAPPKAQPAAPAPAAEPLPPAFEGTGPDRSKRKEIAKEPKENLEAKREEVAKPEATRPPAPQRPPPEQQRPAQAPPQAPAAQTTAPQAPSRPAQARSGEVSQFAKEVVAALAKAKPSASGIKGKVTVTVVVAFGGGVRTARVTGSSGRDDLDKLALEAARKAKLPAPPPDVTTDDLFYDVEYDFK